MSLACLIIMNVYLHVYYFIIAISGTPIYPFTVRAAVGSCPILWHKVNPLDSKGTKCHC